MRRKEERSKQGQTNNKAKQHSTPKAVTFLKKNELPRDLFYASGGTQTHDTPHVHVYIHIISHLLYFKLPVIQRDGANFGDMHTKVPGIEAENNPSV